MVPLLAVSLQLGHRCLKDHQNIGDPHWIERDVAAENNCKERAIVEQSKAGKGEFCLNGADYPCLEAEEVHRNYNKWETPAATTHNVWLVRNFPMDLSYCKIESLRNK